MVDLVRDESGEKPEDAVRKLQRLKKELARARVALDIESTGQDSSALPRFVGDLALEMKRWDDTLEQIRCELADLIVERDRWRIAHDKLRERVDHHPLTPRSDADKKPQSARMSTPRARASSDESQDFTAIDRALEQLNASMLRAFSSE
jgi:regulator of replication initiation timing